MYSSLHQVCIDALNKLGITSFGETCIVNALARGDIYTPSQLLSTPASDIIRIRNIGPQRLEVVEKMRKLISDEQPKVFKNTVKYVYTLWGGTFNCYDGDIVPSSSSPEYGSFMATNHYRVTVSMTSGKVHNAIVWLPEKNDDEAKNLLAKYCNDEIAKYQQKIDCLKQKVNLLNANEGDNNGSTQTQS
jgi:hypothetical protein